MRTDLAQLVSAKHDCVVAPKPLNRAELADLADGLKRLLDMIETGEMSAGSGTVSRLEGAWILAETLAAGRPLDPMELFGTESVPNDLT
jgi:hypothetical protein